MVVVLSSGLDMQSMKNSRFAYNMDRFQEIMICFLLILINSEFILAEPLVNIKYGTLEGSLMKSRKGREFSAFKAIPYAAPPIGELRFRPPQPPASWRGLRSAKDDAEICVQSNLYLHQDEVQGSEDCLYLNVYTPRVPTFDHVKNSYPVMVWIHGGGLVSGSGHSAFCSPKYLLDHDIVLITLNYRLGPLGFLSTADEVIPGNLGLKDQVQALRWVRENIAAFDGDPDCVTVFGLSAGGTSAHYLMLTPLTEGLIHRVISQSGTVRSPWALNKPEIVRGYADRLGKQLNCPIDSSKSLRDCLLTKDAADITAAEQKWRVFDYEPMLPFRPTVEPNNDGALITEDPTELIKAGNVLDIPWMTGNTFDEGSFRAAALYGFEKENYVKKFNDNFLELAPMTLALDLNCPEELHPEVSRKIREFYFDQSPVDETTRFNFIDMYTDAFFTVSVSEAIKGHLMNRKSPVYYYHFSYRGSSTWARAFGDIKRDYGICHGDELFYLFPLNEVLFPDTPLSKEDENMINIITTVWYNFAKTGDPTPESTTNISFKWEQVKTDALEYLSILNSRNIKMSKNLWRDRVEFWKSLPCTAGLAALVNVTHAEDKFSN